MNITVNRGPGDENATPGQMLLDGIFECFTLEPRRDQSKGKPYLTPAGTYAWIKAQSLDLDRLVVCVLNVPGFTGIEIHPGNFPSNTRGCTLVGKTEAVDFVGYSDEEFADLMAKLPDSGEITYQDAPGTASTATEPGRPSTQSS